MNQQVQRKKIKASFASYEPIAGQDSETDIQELARVLLDWGNIPNKLNNIRAYEIMLLAQEYLRLTTEES